MNELQGNNKPRRDITRENLLQAAAIMKAHRMRSGLLILGVAIGITTILSMVTILTGLNRKISKDLVSAGRPYLVVQRFDVFVGGTDEKEVLRRKQFKREDAIAMKKACPSLIDVCYIISPNRFFMLHRKGRKTKPLQVIGSFASMPFIYSLHLGNGRFFTQAEEARRNRVVVLGYGPARDLFPAENPVGKSIRIAGKLYKIIGTFDKRKHFIGAMSDNFAVIPASTFSKDLQTSLDETSITATVKESYSLEQGESELTSLMRIRRGLRAGEKNNFVILSSEAFLKSVGKVTFYIALVLLVISSIGLAVGGIGVMNIMLISVAERTREIGIRMAVGARKNDILQQVLVESATLTGIGGLLGVVMGTGVAVLIASLIHFPFYFSIPWAVISIVFSVLVGIIFGLYPAHRASRLDPVVALRYE